MSASIKPTFAPICARAQAMLAETVLLPTPPLPEAMATTFLTPGSACWRGNAFAGVGADNGGHFDLDLADAGDGPDFFPAHPLDFFFQRAGGRRQFHGESDVGTVYDDVLDHPQRHQVFVKIRVNDAAQRLKNLLRE